MNVLSNVAMAGIGGLPVVVWLGLATIALLLTTGTYGILLFTGKIRGKITTHMMIGGTTIIVALLHAALALSLFV